MANCFQIFVKNTFKFRFLAVVYLGIVPSFSLENSNIPGYDDLYQFFDYNHLRGEFTLEHEKYPDLVATLTVDNESLYKEEPGSLNNKTSIYRAYFEYKGSKHF